MLVRLDDDAYAPARTISHVRVETPDTGKGVVVVCFTPDGSSSLYGEAYRMVLSSPKRARDRAREIVAAVNAASWGEPLRSAVYEVTVGKPDEAEPAPAT